MKSLFILLAMSGNFYNDVLALISLVGTCLMFVGAMAGGSRRRLIAIGEWSLAAVFFGILFQIAILITDLVPDKIGFVIPMQPSLVSALFSLSCVFLIGYWSMKRNQIEDAKG